MKHLKITQIAKLDVLIILVGLAVYPLINAVALFDLRGSEILRKIILVYLVLAYDSTGLKIFNACKLLKLFRERKTKPFNFRCCRRIP